MAKTTQIYGGNLNQDSINLTDSFQNGSFLFLEAPFTPNEVEFDADLQIYLPNNQIRNVPLIEDKRIVDNFFIYFIPGEIQASGYDCKLAIIASDPVSVNIFVVKAGCACEAKLNLLLASEVLDKVASIVVPILTAIGAPQLLLPAAVNAVRGIIEVFNPSQTEPILIGYGRNPSLTNYDRLIEPGGRLMINAWQKEVFAAANGVQPQVREFSREE